jgi:anti-sigma regulatory factor (Ser/Thr protein kinase)
MTNRFTLSNRPENVKLLQEYLRGWGRKRGLARGRRQALEKAATEIFHYIVTRVYPLGAPGSITMALEEKGTRLRLVFEDDGPPYDTATLNTLSPIALSPPAGPDLSSLKKWIDSVTYYRKADRKNRLVAFLTL